MYHSLIISGKNTYDEWGLVPTTRPLVNPPEAKTNYVNNPGGNGQIDFTDELTGSVLYGVRKGSWEFWVRPEDEWANVYSVILNYLHGKKHSIILEDDPNYVYTGRLSVNSWKSDQHNSLIVIDYVLDPFKQVKKDIYSWADYYENRIQNVTIKIEVGSKRHIKIYNPLDVSVIPTIYVINGPVRIYKHHYTDGEVISEFHPPMIDTEYYTYNDNYYIPGQLYTPVELSIDGPSPYIERTIDADGTIEEKTRYNKCTNYEIDTTNSTTASGSIITIIIFFKELSL